MPKVYLAGPISGLSYEGATDWRDEARAALLLSGIDCFSPMRHKKSLAGERAIMHDYPQHVLSNQRAIMTRDRHDTFSADCVLMNLTGVPDVTVGTMMELAWADARRTPVVCVLPVTRRTTRLLPTARAALAAAMSASLLIGVDTSLAARGHGAEAVSLSFSAQPHVVASFLHVAAGVGGLEIDGKSATSESIHALPRRAVTIKLTGKALLEAAVATADYVDTDTRVRLVAAADILDPANARRRVNASTADTCVGIFIAGLADVSETETADGTALDIGANNVHEHPMVREAIGFRTANLPEAIMVTRSLLCAG